MNDYRMGLTLVDMAVSFWYADASRYRESIGGYNGAPVNQFRFVP